ncbi:MAG: ribonuclease R [Kaiparowitsia implicata GSE-PSE-MK54-09C]|jgi:exoribonuclease-2|nr:ribonuclease R [Kaiparowitsia implicata GSE-PSE-MK54-09C]
MEKGSLIEFRLQGDRRLAVVDRPEGKRDWIVLDAGGHSHKLHPRDVTYTVAASGYKPSDIAGFLQQVQPYLDPSSLEVAWELLLETGDATNPAEMALLLFSSQDAPLCYAAHVLLSDDKLYFKQKGDRYEPRPATQVEDLKHHVAIAQQRQHEWQQVLDRMQQAIAGTSVEWEPGDRGWIESLERFATLGEDATHRTPALDVLSALDRATTSEAAFKLLVDMRHWSQHENLSLRRSQIPMQFPNRVLEVTHSTLTNPPPDSSPDRRDLTHIKVYTIDDESTREIDDGLSVEFLDAQTQRIWIHIADPTRWLTPGDVLDLEARRRCTTVYLPTGMVPMFPAELATGPMSLIQGQVCHALSFGVVLDATGVVQDYEICPTLIKPTYRLTYEDVDEILELGVQAEPELQALHHWATQRFALRLAQGAISIRLPESSIKVLGDDIVIDVFDDSASRQLVAEMMILTGEVAGRYGQAHQLPLPFRGQTQPELPSDDELNQLPAGPVRYVAIRRCMPRSEVSISPLRHASLGLDTYTQVTSPIRRYSDMLAHFQIKAHLRGEALPFNEEQLQQVLQAVGTTAYEATMVERQTNRYWSLEFLRRHEGQVWNALMLRWLREHESLGLVLLEDLGLELAMRFDRDIYPGDRLDVRVSYVDPRQDVIHFQEVLNPVPEAALG